MARDSSEKRGGMKENRRSMRWKSVEVVENAALEMRFQNGTRGEKSANIFIGEKLRSGIAAGSS
jgi:hypothetical protein